MNPVDSKITATTRLVAYYLLAALWIVPVIWMAATAFKPTPEVMSFVPKWIPSQITLDHFWELLDKRPFFLWLMNSFYVALGATAVTVVVTTFAAYALARMNWPGRNIVLVTFLIGMFIPWEINAIPLFFIVKDMGLLNTYAGVFLPLSALPISLFLLRQFFINIPTDLEDAARIDGCGHLRIIWHVIVPVSLPAYGALVIFIFIFSWNEFFWSLIALQKSDVRTMPIGLKTLTAAADIQYDLMMAGSFLATVPALIVFLVLRRQVISGISMAGVRR
jgi:ABC-type glycerol-3-phosphate transport system permease component